MCAAHEPSSSPAGWAREFRRAVGDGAATAFLFQYHLTQINFGVRSLNGQRSVLRQRARFPGAQGEACDPQELQVACRSSSGLPVGAHAILTQAAGIRRRTSVRWKRFFAMGLQSSGMGQKESAARVRAISASTPNTRSLRASPVLIGASLPSARNALDQPVQVFRALEE